MSQSRGIDCRLPEAYIWEQVILEKASCCSKWKLELREASATAKELERQTLRVAAPEIDGSMLADPSFLG